MLVFTNTNKQTRVATLIDNKPMIDKNGTNTLSPNDSNDVINTDEYRREEVKIHSHTLSEAENDYCNELYTRTTYVLNCWSYQ